MDQTTLHAIEARCTQEAPPRCQTACPFGLDVRAFLGKMADGKMAEARKIYERHVPLPELMARVCDHPCETACVLRDLGGGLAMSALEYCCVENSTAGKTLARSPKPGTAAVLGNGLAGLVAAAEMSRKNYAVTVFHEGSAESGLLRRFPNLQADFRLSGLDGVEFESGKPDMALLERVKAEGVVFVDADACAELAPPRAAVAPDTLLLDNIAYGGWLCTSPTGHEYASASQQGAEGRRAAVTLQRMLEGVSLTAVRGELDRPGESRLHVRLDGIVPAPRILPAGEQYTEDEARAEAARCIRCTCLACVKECVFLQKYRSFPRAYARQVYNNMSIVKGQRLANRLINSCTLCGQCTEICPERFSMAELCLSARQDMVERNYMPQSAYAFALEDMESAAQAGFVLPDAARKTPAAFALFPGCQLPASRPEQTARLFAFMHPLWRERGGLALMQNCCGVPTHWAGQENLFRQHLDRLREEWKTLGRPHLLMACASCLKTFRDALPDIPVSGLWEELDAAMPGKIIPEQRETTLPSMLTIHDPCAARNDKGWQLAVRSLARKHGLSVQEPRLSGKTTACCGYGGGVWNAQPDMAEAMSAQRAEALAGAQGALVSCVMCRDRLAKFVPAWHILDALIPTVSETERSIPGLSARRANRMMFRSQLLGIEGAEGGEPTVTPSLRVAPDVLTALEERFILRGDMEAAVAGVEASGLYFVETDSGHRVGAWRPGNVTFWVRYSVDVTGGMGVMTLHDGWCHRMRVPGASQPHENVPIQPRRLDKA